MKNKKFELFITQNFEQQVLEVNSKPIFIGSTDNCPIQIDEQGVKGVIQLQGDKIALKSLDPSLKFELNGEEHQNLTVEESCFLTFAGIDIVLSVEELAPELPATPLPEAPVALGEVNPPELPVEDKVVVKEEKEEVLDHNIDNFFTFSTVFEESHLGADTIQSQKAVAFDYSAYIDPSDETRKTLPGEDITIPLDEKCIRVSYKNNGILINSQYFDLDHNKIFISKAFEDKDTIQVHDCDQEKAILLINRQGDFLVNRIDDYTLFCDKEGEGVLSLDENSVELQNDDKIILVRGTAQIIIEYSEKAPLINKPKFFETDEQLLKNVASSWALAIASLLILFLAIETPVKEDKPKRELVVIYKRKKVEKASAAASQVKTAAVEKPVTEPPAAPPTEMKTEVVKKKEPTVKKVTKVKTIAKVKPKKAKSKKLTARKSRKKFSKVAKKSAPKAVKKKSYSFSSSSKMMAAVGSNKSSFKSAKKARFDSSNALGRSGRISNNVDSRKVGKIGTSVSRFATGSLAGNASFRGTRGLSGKSKAATAYLETSTKVLGAMDPELIRKIMREYIPQFRYCYQRELVVDSKVAGVFDISFKINSVGKGVKVGVSSNGKGFSKKGINCLKRVVSMIKFPRPRGGGTVDVRQPMNFFK